MAERRGAVRRRLAIVLTAASAAGGVLTLLPARHAQAYDLECCPFPRNWAPKLVMAERPGGGTDNASWFQTAVVNGVNAWNDAPTPVYISTELYQDNQDIVFDVTNKTSDSQFSNGVCTNYSNSTCYQATIHLYQFCSASNCGMQQSTPNYDAFIVSHETGHALGEDHSCVRNVLMSGAPVNNPACSGGNPPYSYYSESNFIGEPQQDDINGIVKMYGSDSYQYNDGCSDMAGSPRVTVPTPAPQQPQELMTLPPVPTLPSTPAQVQSIEQEAQAAKDDPVGTATGLGNDALAATGKVVPWYSLPNPGTIGLPAGLGYVNRPC